VELDLLRNSSEDGLFREEVYLDRIESSYRDGFSNRFSSSQSYPQAQSSKLERVRSRSSWTPRATSGKGNIGFRRALQKELGSSFSSLNLLCLFSNTLFVDFSMVYPQVCLLTERAPSLSFNNTDSSLSLLASRTFTVKHHRRGSGSDLLRLPRKVP